MAALSSSVLPSRCAVQQFDGLRALQNDATFSQNVMQCPVSTSRQGRLVVRAERKALKKKQIVLLEDVPNLGKSGELLSVKKGYFRNFLLPTGKAKTATEQILKGIRLENARIEAERLRVLEEAKKTALQFQTVGGFNVRRKQGMGKAIFGTVTTADLADIIKANTGKEVDKKDITLPEIKEVGQYTAQIKLHPEVVAEVRVTVIGGK
eukprot:TRINITY_DN786_c0_g1_i1.p1 TRINITY_DN786_c0_g1~~TRINITY_DN786_c0_g1_i1.p1  ORF type:complete len:223 (+),score=49.95 TRINITY_DN786_c0_g1_i1:48-671(+)